MGLEVQVGFDDFGVVEEDFVHWGVVAEVGRAGEDED